MTVAPIEFVPAVVGNQQPRIMHVPESASSTWPEAQELLALAGMTLDPWQQLVLEHSLGETAAGKWAAFEVVVNVARQNGKGEILLARELIGMYLLEEKFQVHSAHQVDTSLEAFRRLLDVMEAVPDLDKQVARVTNTNGREAIQLKNGCRIRFRSRSRGGGRGFTGDALYLDECMFLPEFAIGALMPALSGRSMQGDPQVWYAGSAVDQTVHDNGIVFARLRERALAGDDPALAYFEWSIDGDGPSDVDEETAVSESAWAQANPGLGIRISPAHVAKEQRSMDKRTFAVERLGVGDWPAGDDTAGSALRADDWRALTDPRSVLEDPIVLGVDVTMERKTSIVACGRNQDGKWHLEIVYALAGTGWVTERLIEICAKHQVLEVVTDGYGPSSAIAQKLEHADLAVRKLDSVEFAAACGQLVDLVGEEAVVHLGEHELEMSIRGAKTRPLVDRWAWSRTKSSAEIGVLVAATIALWSAVDNDGSGEIAIY